MCVALAELQVVEILWTMASGIFLGGLRCGRVLEGRARFRVGRKVVWLCACARACARMVLGVWEECWRSTVAWENHLPSSATLAAGGRRLETWQAHGLAVALRGWNSANNNKHQLLYGHAFQP